MDDDVDVEKCSGSILIVLSLSTKPLNPAVTLVLRRGAAIVVVVPPAETTIFDEEVPVGAVFQSTEMITR